MCPVFNQSVECKIQTFENEKLEFEHLFLGFILKEIVVRVKQRG